MSCFTESLKALMALHEPPLTGASLAERAKMSQATVSRLLSGQEPTCEHVALFCAVISPERERRVELLLAHLRDVVRACSMAGIDERHVVLSAPADLESNGSLGADIELLADECAKHEDTRAVVAELAGMILRHRAEVADAMAAVYPFPVPVDAAVADAPVAATSAAVPLAALKRKAAQAGAPRASKATPAPRK